MSRRSRHNTHSQSLPIDPYDTDIDRTFQDLTRTQSGNLYVDKAIMVETSRYKDMFLRPYETTYDNQIETLLDEYTNGGRNVNAATVGRVSNLFLRPSGMPESAASIVNGFDERRYSFMISIKTAGRSVAGEITTVVTGYTSYLGVVNGRHGKILDPDMELYFNGIHVYRDTEVRTRTGGLATVSNMSASNQIAHTSTSCHDMPYSGGTPKYMCRPSDIAATLSLHNDPVMSEFRQQGASDATVRLTGSPQTSSRKNLSRTNYLSNVITKYRSAVEACDNIDEIDVWNASKDRLRERSLHENQLFMELSMQTDYASTGSVSYGQLCSILGNLDDVCEVADSHTQYSIESTENWDAATIEAQAATLIQQSITSIMSDCLMLTIEVLVTNNTIDGSLQLTWLSAPESFSSGIDMVPKQQLFEERLIDELMIDVSQNNEREFWMTAKVEMLYETSIEISFDNEEPVLFVAPAFCDVLYSPVITTSESTLINMASDIQSLLLGLSSIGAQTQWVEPTDDGRRASRRANSMPRGFKSHGDILIPSNI